MQHYDVIVVGNGPSAITLSFMLSGNWPYYLNNGLASCSDPALKMLHERLMDPDESEFRELQSENTQNELDHLKICHCTQDLNFSSETESIDSGNCVSEERDDDLDDEIDNTTNNQSENLDWQIEDDWDKNKTLDELNFSRTSLNSRHKLNKKPLSPQQIVKKSLIERNLEYLSSGLTGRTVNPISLLLDNLEHPQADIGKEKSSVLTWKHDPKRSFSHLVIGRGLPGGAWSDMEGCSSSLTISMGAWMQLPTFPIHEWSKRQKATIFTNGRMRLNAVANYYQDYMVAKQLQSNFQNNSEVQRIRYCDLCGRWLVDGQQLDPQASNGNNRKFCYTAKNVVLATGSSTKVNRLRVPGERLPFVLKSLIEMERTLDQTPTISCDPLMVVGAGLSAADAILSALSQGLSIVHVFRKHPDDASLVFNQLPESVYPEYRQVHALMAGREKHPLYRPYALYIVKRVHSNHEVELRNVMHGSGQDAISCIVRVSHILPLLGTRPNLKFLRPKKLRSLLPAIPHKPLDSRSNPLLVDPITHECARIRHLFAMGPLVGDNFVRFLQGSALAICAKLWADRKKSLSRQIPCLDR